MRTAIAAAFVAVVVVVAAVLGWQAVSSRLEPDDDAGPEQLYAELASAWSGGDRDAIAALFRSGSDAFLAGLDALEAGLAPSSTGVTAEDVEVDEARATGTLEVTLEIPRIGDVSWQTTVDATRERGEWLATGSRDAVHPDLGATGEFAILAENVFRAPIVGVGGEPLTPRGSGYDVGFAPDQIINEERLRLAWANTLPDTLDELIEELERGDLVPDWFYPVATVPEDRIEDVRAGLRGVPGVIIRENEGDETFTGDTFARHVLGRVGEPTAEQAEEFGVPVDTQVGLYGLERVFEDQLVGSDRARAVVQEPDGDVIVELAVAQEDASAPLQTTLDRDVQKAVENALAGVSSEVGVVVVDADTSAIRASASRPVTGYNLAWEGRFAPGDALLPVTAEVLYAAGVDADEPTTCPDAATVAGAQLFAPLDLGETTVQQALAAGCDTTVGALAADLDEGELEDGARRFGFGTEFDLPLASTGGSFPTPVDRTERVRAAVGQARVQTSVLHMATVAAATASGQWRPPTLLADADPAPATSITSTAVGDLGLLLQAGASPEGSARALADTGAAAIGGTAAETGRADEHAWVVGTVDGLAFAVLAADTDGNRSTADTVAANFVRELAALQG